jgi:hypothetical protein
MNHVKMKNCRFKRKEVDIPGSNTLLNFNNETSNLKERLLQYLRIVVEEQHSKTLIVKSQGLKLINNIFLF